MNKQRYQDDVRWYRLCLADGVTPADPEWHLDAALFAALLRPGRESEPDEAVE